MKAGAVHWPVLGTLQPWQQVFLATGLPGLVLAFGVFAFREPPRRKSAAASAGYGEALGFIRANPMLFGAIFGGFGLAYAVTIGFQLWTPSYFVRVHHWEPARIGLVLGLTQIAAAALMPVHGLIVDALYRHGRRDGQLFWCLITGLCAAPCGIAAYMVASPWATVALYGLFLTFILSTASMGPAIVQVVTPSHLRGRVSALYVLSTGVIALAGGPSFVGLITDKILHDPLKVGVSLITTIVCVLLPAVLLFALGRRAMRAVDERTPI
jgi:hypothetical protein